MNIQPNITPVPANQMPTDAAMESDAATLDGNAFALLLQGAKKLDADVQTTELLAEPALISMAERLDVDGLLGQMPGLDSVMHSRALSEVPAEVALAVPGQEEGVSLDVESLLAETLRLDQRADMSLRDGNHVWMPQSAASHTAWHTADTVAAQPQVAVGQEVATVAAGVQRNVWFAHPAGPRNEALAMAATVVEQANDISNTVSEVMNEAQGKSASQEGRFSLQGAWALESSQVAPNAVMQRVMGQIEHWALSSAGAQPKANDRSDSNKALLESAQTALQGHSSGMRLTDHAVREVQSSQTAAFTTAQEAPAEDMRFWLQGKQQRAELMLDRDGQPVRVQVSVRGNDAHVTFLSEQQQTRDSLDASLAQLREMLAQQGVQLKGVSIQAQSDAPQQDAPSQHSDNGAAQQSNVQHARIAVPENSAPRGGRIQGLDVYA